jgi:hypothetical protein
MAEDNLPVSTGPVAVPTPPTQEELVEDISNLLEDPATDLPEEPEEAAAPTEDDDPLGLAEDVDAETADAGDESEEAEIKGGRFAPDSAKVTLDDGTVTTIAELKRGTMFQRDYTKKTQELSEERKSFEAERQQVSQYAQQLDQSREYIAWYAEQFLPKQPEPFKGDARTDPQGFLEWQQSVAQWQAHAQAWQQFQQSKADQQAQQSGETQKQQEERMQREADALFKAMPVLKDPVKGKQVWDNIVAGAASLGFSSQEVNSITDHRMVLALRKAIAYDRIKTSAPKVQAEVSRRPVVNNGRRAPANQQANREKQARTERLRNDPSFDNGVAALMDFDL